jgi:uncharacterized membrane protein YczE
MDVVGAIGAINAIIIAFFIYNKKERSLSNKILTIWVIAFALHFSIPFFIERKLFLHDAYWGFILGIVIVSHTPFLFVYPDLCCILYSTSGFRKRKTHRIGL